MVALLLSHACGAFFSTEFYKEQLRDAEVYDFLYDDVLAAAVDEVLQEGGGLPPGVDLDSDSVVAKVREALPPDWLQEQVESAIDNVGPYMLGESDSFTYSVSLADRSDAAEAAAVSLMERIDLHESLFAERVPKTVAERLAGRRELPFGIELTVDETVAAVERVVTPTFLRSQQGKASEALAAYLIGRTDSFGLTFSLSERTAALEQELRRVLEGANLTTYVRRTALDPALDQNVAADVAMPLGVVVTREEIRQAIASAATEEWLGLETRLLVGSAVPYLSGRHDGFDLTVPLVERTDAAVQELTDTVIGKYAGLLATVPLCTSEQLRALAQGRPVDLCRLRGFTTEDFLWAAGIDVEASLGTAVHDMTPEEVTITDQDLLEGIDDPEDVKFIEDLRGAMTEGWSVDEEGLLEALEDEDLPSTVDTLRRGFREGWAWTEQDLRDIIADPDSADAAETLDAFDRGRGALGVVRIVAALLPFLVVGMAAGAGLLGACSWHGRLGWAGGALFAAALVTVILSGPIYDSQVGDRLRDVRAESVAEADGRAESLVVGKVLDTATQVSDEFIGGVRLRSLALMLLGAVAVGGAFAWGRCQRSEGARQSSGEPVGPPEAGAASASTKSAEAGAPEPEAGGKR